MAVLAIVLFVVGFCVIAYNVEQAQKDWVGILGYVLCILGAVVVGYGCC